MIFFPSKHFEMIFTYTLYTAKDWRRMRNKYAEETGRFSSPVLFPVFFSCAAFHDGRRARRKSIA
jgi:hypothetical protein